MTNSKTLAVGLVAAVAALLVPSGASALTSTIGSNLATAPAGSSLNCGSVSGCTILNSVVSPSTRAAGGLTSPVNGVVVRWRIRTGASLTSETTPRIVRPNGVGAGRGQPVTPALNQISTFDTRLPISAGDFFAIDQAGASATRTPVTGSSYSYWFSPVLAEAGAPRSYNATELNTELLVNADVEPDADGDGYGDQTQDACPQSAATPGAGCLLTVNVGPGGKVTGTGIDCPGDCTERYQSGTIVTLTSDPDKGFLPRFFEPSGECILPEDCTVAMFKDHTVSETFADIDPPETTITKGPKKRTHKSKVKIKFKSDEKGSRFLCSVDEKKFDYCKSPYTAKLKPGRHVFRVEAVAPNHIADHSPAKVSFRVLG